VGNDGFHFNQSIDQGYNSTVSATVAEASHDASDHLPVTMKIAVDTHLGVEEIESNSCPSIAPNPANGMTHVYFYNTTDGQVYFDIYSLQGQLVASQSSYFVQGERDFSLSLDDMTPGFYLLRISNKLQTLATLKLIVK
jgi:hypothetical protein